MGLSGAPIVYHDDFRDEVREQLLGLPGALVWVNPIEQGCDRTHLDQLLGEAAAAGLSVSMHPDTIFKLGTKQVLGDAYAMSCSAPGTCGMMAHRTQEELRTALQSCSRTGQRARHVCSNNAVVTAGWDACPPHDDTALLGRRQSGFSGFEVPARNRMVTSAHGLFPAFGQVAARLVRL